MMRIGELARRTGLSVDTLRFYEKVGLITPKHFVRLESGYRDYGAAVIEHLSLIKGAQAAGFTLKEIVLLFARWDASQLTAAEIAVHVQNKLNHITAKISALQQVQCYLEQKLCTVTGARSAERYT